MEGEFVRATLVLLVINLVYSVIALFVGVLAVRLIDKLILKKIDLEEEIQKGNVAAAIFGGVLVLFVAVIIGFALAR
jgi:uncharacterized membrane protein YjfL (UPF0719 family)